MLKPTAKDGAVTRFLRQTEIDSRLVGMVAALVLIWVGFHVYGAVANGFGAFLTPRNLWNLSVQTASIGIMATGMVFVIVTRHIDLSVGSVLGVCAMSMAIV
ncbi:MAG: sugar ABC transporter permease, partial [Pseudomonadota bacterium]